MKKQISHPNLIPRLFATALDLFFLSLAQFSIANFLSKFLFFLFFQNFLTERQIDLWVFKTIDPVINSKSFHDYFVSSTDNTKQIIIYTVLCFVIFNLIIPAVYFISFWRYKGATPGKIIMHMKIVDARSFTSPTTGQLFIRFLGYGIAIFGIWLIVFSKRRQALHDKMAKTVVIKA